MIAVKASSKKISPSGLIATSLPKTKPKILPTVIPQKPNNTAVCFKQTFTFLHNRFKIYFG
jgi:hypothetical protein